MNITCSALPEALLESELFGHERGAFTGADRQKRGLLETADGGTVFLDEIGEMAPGLQAKLLRFLEEKTFKRVGGIGRHPGRRPRHRGDQPQARGRGARAAGSARTSSTGSTCCRSCCRRCATGADDIPPLVDFYVDSYNAEFKKHVRGVAPEAMKRLQAYGWPGNIRELRNAVERAMLLSDGDVLQSDDFTIGGPAPRGSATASNCRPTASISSSSNARWSSRRSSGPVEPDPAPPASSASIAIRSATASRSSRTSKQSRSQT